MVEGWAAAEQGNDAEALDGLLADDFVGVGPLGFVLGRDQWLARFGNGLENRSLAVEDAQVRDYGSAAIVVGVLAQETSFRGGDNSGRFRLTLVAVRPATAGCWPTPTSGCCSRSARRPRKRPLRGYIPEFLALGTDQGGSHGPGNVDGCA